MNPITNPIGITDSGLGGLSVLQQALCELPHERFVFLADQSWMPYGDKPVHEITARVMALANWFHKRPCKSLVLACNTATAAAAEAVRNQYSNWPVVGIEPAVKPAAMMSRTGTVGILGTSNTLASERFRALVARFETVAEVIAQPCPGLVELIESVPMDQNKILESLKPNVESLMSRGADVIVLGCTHYPFVRQEILSLVGSEVQIIETGLPVAKQLKNRLAEQQLLLEQPSGGASSSMIERVQFLTTSNADVFKQGLVGLLGPTWLDAQVQSVKIV